MNKESYVNDELKKYGLKLNRALFDHHVWRKYESEIKSGGKRRFIVRLDDNAVSWGVEGLNLDQKKIVESLGGHYEPALSAFIILVI